MTDFVPTYETCSKLGEAGWDTLTLLVYAPRDGKPVLVWRELVPEGRILAPAPMLGELVRELKSKLKIVVMNDTPDPIWNDVRIMAEFEHEIGKAIMEKEPEEAAAEMLLKIRKDENDRY